MKFNLNLLELSFLGKELYNVTIAYYPMLILEFMDGNYTTTELFLKNDYLANGYDIQLLTKDSSGSNVDENLNIGNILESLPDIYSINDDDPIEIEYDRNASMSINSQDMSQRINIGNKDISQNNKRTGSILSYSEAKKNQNKDTNNNKTENEKEDKKDKKNKKIKNKKKSKKISKEIKEKKIDSYGFNDYLGLYVEKILFFRDELNQKKPKNKKEEFNFISKNENYGKIIELYKRKERMEQIKKQISFYKNKDQDINNLKLKLQHIISSKKDLLNKLNQNINSYKTKYTELKTTQTNLVPQVAKQQLIYDSFLNKKMGEICFVFFNKKIKSLYFIPDIFKSNIKNDNNDYIKKRFEFYNNNKKKISSMMGYITQLMIYMSKCFDIPLRYPLWLNGAKSFIIKGKKDRDKDFLPLHCDLKRDDKYTNFESGLNYLKNDFKEIINFCSMYPEIIPVNESNKFNRDNGDYTFFNYFISFNHCLGEFLKYIQNMFD